MQLLEVVGEASVSLPGGMLDKKALQAAGIYVGAASSDYGSLVQQHVTKGVFHATANALSVISGRISYSLGFMGPSMTGVL